MWGNAVSPEGKEVAIPHDTESRQDSMKSRLNQSPREKRHLITNLLSLAMGFNITYLQDEIVSLPVTLQARYIALPCLNMGHTWGCRIPNLVAGFLN